MLPKWHILIGFVFSTILISFFNFSILAATIVFLSSVFIDIDHYFRYIFIKRKSLKIPDWSPFKFWEWSMKNHFKLTETPRKERKQHVVGHFIFHGIEFLAILIVLSFFSAFFFWVLLGCLVHLAGDYLDMVSRGSPIYSKVSQVYLWKRNKRKKEFN